jgi:hypothetical protein
VELGDTELSPDWEGKAMHENEQAGKEKESELLRELRVIALALLGLLLYILSLWKKSIFF